MVAHMSSAIATAKGGESSGTGFLWSKHLPVLNQGKLFCDPRRTSLELLTDTIAVTFVSFYGPQDSKETEALLADTLTQLRATGKPYMIMGDFNMPVDAV
jgi:hypothetical protein